MSLLLSQDALLEQELIISNPEAASSSSAMQLHIIIRSTPGTHAHARIRALCTTNIYVMQFTIGRMTRGRRVVIPPLGCVWGNPEQGCCDCADNHTASETKLWIYPFCHSSRVDMITINLLTLLGPPSISESFVSWEETNQTQQ